MSNIIETFQGTITRTTGVKVFKVVRNTDSGGSIEFHVAKTLSQDGVEIGVEELTPYTARFDELPETFPVTISGNIVQVSGQTILDALDAVATAVVQAQSGT